MGNLQSRTGKYPPGLESVESLQMPPSSHPSSRVPCSRLFSLQGRPVFQSHGFLKKEGHALNSSGGEVKGTPAQLLEQSSTLADQVDVIFQEGVFPVPSCYYEFAKRYPDADGKIFSGFIAGSADKIFESTDFRKA